MERSEKDLIRRCQNGDRKAFAELVDRYKVTVFNLVDRMIFDKSLAEDMALKVTVPNRREHPLPFHPAIPFFSRRHLHLHAKGERIGRMKMREDYG